MHQYISPQLRVKPQSFLQDKGVNSFQFGLPPFHDEVFVKETKMENKVHTQEENFNTDPYFYFIPEGFMP